MLIVSINIDYIFLVFFLGRCCRVVHRKVRILDTPPTDMVGKIPGSEDIDERREGLRKYYLMKISSYGNGFTVHGLAKGIYGNSVERVFWLTLVSLAAIVGFIVLHALIKKYLRFTVHTEIHTIITPNNYFPSITFCEQTLLFDSFFAYCGTPARLANESDGRVRFILLISHPKFNR